MDKYKKSFKIFSKIIHTFPVKKNMEKYTHLVVVVLVKVMVGLVVVVLVVVVMVVVVLVVVLLVGVVVVVAMVMGVVVARWW